MRTLYNRRLTSIDLLPESIQGPKKRRRRIILFAAAQVAIFLCMYMIIMGVRGIANRAWDNSTQIAIEINTMRQSQEVTATQDIEPDMLLFTDIPADFSPLWVMAAVQADEGYMTSLSYTDNSILLTGLTDDMLKINTHIQNLLDTEMFMSVSMGRTNWLDDGWFFYELLLVPNTN